MQYLLTHLESDATVRRQLWNGLTAHSGTASCLRKIIKEHLNSIIDAGKVEPVRNSLVEANNLLTDEEAK